MTGSDQSGRIAAVEAALNKVRKAARSDYLGFGKLADHEIREAAIRLVAALYRIEDPFLKRERWPSPLERESARRLVAMRTALDEEQANHLCTCGDVCRQQDGARCYDDASTKEHG